MNTIFHIVAMIAFLWLAVYCFGTLDQDALGYVALGFFLGFIPLTIGAAFDDWDMLSSKGKRRPEE